MKDEKIVSKKSEVVHKQKTAADRQRDLEMKRIKEVPQNRGVVIRYDVDEKGTTGDRS